MIYLLLILVILALCFPAMMAKLFIQALKIAVVLGFTSAVIMAVALVVN